ncbi:hypothetical protein OS493_020505 [Desmophyllum pertusum]|uniref:Uncharacterized protein n=1 Tax=Desmophyllum pertusum TaxID=174260 RepID=A0A9W9YZ77_9CNID|nr:hypothetical protein OS493_020505 [Desmophyllum pertusum]
MLSRWETVFLNTLICISVLFQVSSQSNSISFTDDKPRDDKQVQLGTDVSLSWGFSYNDQAKITNGPWNAPGVQEITFGTWKYINKELFLDKKIVTVDSNGVLRIAVDMMTVKWIGVDSVNLEVAGLVKYVGQGENTTVRNETAYLSETADLLFKRSAYDQSDDFYKYKILKGNVTIISIGREQDGKAEYCLCQRQCVIGSLQERYSLRYENETQCPSR